MLCGLRRTGIGLIAAGVVLTGAEQPIAFPHNKHVARGLECTDCHITADMGAGAGMPSVRQCMLCHRMIATKGPGVQKLLQYAKARREVPWERVYGFEAGAEVKFQHATHIRAKIECKACHGEVEKMTVAQPTMRQTMGRCLDCHRERHATEDCAACHY